jgi:hypothetical protein
VLVVDGHEGGHFPWLPLYLRMTEKFLQKLDFFVLTELSMLRGLMDEYQNYLPKQLSSEEASYSVDDGENRYLMVPHSVDLEFHVLNVRGSLKQSY